MDSPEMVVLEEVEGELGCQPDGGVRAVRALKARVAELKGGIRELFASQDDFDVSFIQYMLEFRNTEQTAVEPDEPGRSDYAWHGLAKLVGLVDADGDPVPDEIAKLMPDQRGDIG